MLAHNAMNDAVLLVECGVSWEQAATTNDYKTRIFHHYEALYDYYVFDFEVRHQCGVVFVSINDNRFSFKIKLSMVDTELFCNTIAMLKDNGCYDLHVSADGWLYATIDIL
jgi:hypothetical protein